MSLHDAEPPRDSSPPVDPETISRGEAPQGLPSTIRVLTLVLIAGLIAGLVSWLLGESVEGRFRPTPVASGGIPTAADSVASTMRHQAGVTLDATLAFGMLGAILGWTLGAAGGLARGSTRSALTAAIVGAVLGALAVALAARILVPINFRLRNPDTDDLILAFLIQSGIGAVAGAVAGGAFGMGLGGRSLALKASWGGVLGAVVGVLIYQFGGALAFPLDDTTMPISATSTTRLLARLSVTIFASLGAAMSVLPSPRTRNQVASKLSGAPETPARSV